MEETSTAAADGLDDKRAPSRDGEMDGEQQQQQPLSHHVATLKFWCTFSVAPAAFCLLHWMIVSIATRYQHHQSAAYYKLHRADDPSDAALAAFRYTCTYWALLLLVDTPVLFRAGGWLQSQLNDMDDKKKKEAHDDTSSSKDDEDSKKKKKKKNHHHVHAQVSRKLDAMLGHKSPPRVSILVSLLYVASCLAGAYSMSLASLWFYASTEHAATYCTVETTISSSEFLEMAEQGNTANTMQNLPDELQKWAESWDTPGTGTFTHGSGGDFVHMTDGTTFFLGKNSHRRAHSLVHQAEVKDSGDNSSSLDGERATTPWSPRRLVSTGSDGTLRVHNNVFDPKLLTNVQGESELQSEAVCCLYSAVEKNHTKSTKAMCVVSIDDGGGLEAISDGSFRNVTVGSPCCGENDDDLEAELAMAYQGEYWVLLVYESFHRDGNQLHDQQRMEIYKIDPSVMKIDLVVNATGDTMPSKRNSHHNQRGGWLWAIAVGPCPYCVEPCRYCIGIIGRSVASACLLVGSFWLYCIRQLQAGASPACLAIWAMLSFANARAANTAELVFATAITVSLLGEWQPTKWFGREALVWMLYSTLACYASTEIYVNLYIGVRLHYFLLMSIFGILLDHPVLQLWGWVIGLLSAYAGFVLSGSVVWFLIWAFVGTVLGGGFVAAGNTLSKYRAFLCFHLKRLWMAVGTRGMKKSPSSSSVESMTGSPSENEPTRGLIRRNKPTSQPNV